MVSPGDEIECVFSFSAEDMRAFRTLSGDDSLVHCDPVFARERGMRDVIVYGGLLTTRLSEMVGTRLPGRRGISTAWSIVFRSPLYVDEVAVLRLEVVNVSMATGLVDGRFRITAADRVIATGTAQSLLPPGELAVEADDGA